MKVLKFGGASVGSIKNLQQVKRIVEGVNEPVVIVVSAVENVTDMLIDTTMLAAKGNASYTEKLDTIITTHNQLIEGLMSAPLCEEVKKEVSTLHEELQNILKGVYLIKDLTAKTEDVILSYGERISSLFISKFLDAKFLDSRNFIKTNNSLGNANVDSELTYKLIREEFSSSNDKRTVIAGFIASDAETSDVTTLGRGGSDCTAALVAAALGASKIEIWNTNYGFMTADPSVTRKAYKIDHLSYSEAMELCNFGATVLFPPSIYPAYVANIPIQIMNIEDPEVCGTLISTDVKDEKTIKGISSIEDSALVTIQGMGMMNVRNVNGRIFLTLDYNGIHTFFVSQASSGSSISIGVKTEDAETVTELLSEEFNEEMTMGAINSINTEKDLSTIAIVGDNMRQATGTAGKLFNALGRNNINIIALAQGSAETNISCVVKRADLRKALNCIHESFFLSEYQQLNLFVVGTGTVGGSLLEQLHTQKDLLMKQNNLMVKVIGIADVSNYILDRDGIDLTQYQELLKSGKTSTPEIIKQALIDLNIYNCVFVDCTASGAIANIYKDLLLHNISVVAANKIAASGDYDNYMELK
ncbi:MAG: aspartate kinase, partial [Paludibacteraceae bacterium]|nr:aspartate kinase [Paludibacteraceae bacterium]